MLYAFSCSDASHMVRVEMFNATYGRWSLYCSDEADSVRSVVSIQPAAYVADAGALSFDLESMELAIGGMLLLFAVGLGVGLIASQVRKLGKI